MTETSTSNGDGEMLRELLAKPPQDPVQFNASQAALRWLAEVERASGGDPKAIKDALAMVRESAATQIKRVGNYALQRRGGKALMLSGDGRVMTPHAVAAVEAHEKYGEDYYAESLRINEQAKDILSSRRPDLRLEDKLVIASNLGSLNVAHRVAAYLGMLNPDSHGLRDRGSQIGYTVFPDGETKFAAGKHDNFRGKTVVIPFAPFGPHQDAQLRELKHIMDVARQKSADGIKVIFFSFPYQRQDGQRQNPGRNAPIESETLKEVCKELGASGKVDEVVVLDFHPRSGNAFMEEFADSFRFLYGSYMLVPAARDHFGIQGKLNSTNTVVAPPDDGSNPRAEFFAEQWGLKSLMAEKKRDPSGKVIGIRFLGEPKEILKKNIVFVDDMVASGGTFETGTREIWRIAEDAGIPRDELNFYYVATNSIFSGNGFERLCNLSSTRGILTLNISPNGNYPFVHDKLVVADAAPIAAEAAFQWGLMAHGDSRASISVFDDTTLPADSLPTFLSSCFDHHLVDKKPPAP